MQLMDSGKLKPKYLIRISIAVIYLWVGILNFFPEVSLIIKYTNLLRYFNSV